MKKLEEIDLKEMDSNPLVDNSFRIKINKVIDKNGYKMEEGLWIPKEIEMDAARVTKVYLEADYRKLMCLLSEAALRLFVWLVYEADSGKDWIRINKERYMKEVDLRSIKTYKKAVAELSRLHIIYPHHLYRSVYWINPRLFFNGSRVMKYPKNVDR